MGKRPTTKTRIGIIGTGSMATVHAQSYKKIRGVELTACFDVDEKRARAFADRHSFKHAVTCIDELIDAVDAVSIVTPDRFHAPLTIQLLKAGKHVLCEKPLAITLPEARRVARIASQAGDAGVIHMINFTYRNFAGFHEAVRLVSKGALGEIRHVHSRHLQHWLASNQWGNWTQEQFLWRLQTEAGSGGVLGDVGCHLLDFVTGIAGDLNALSCRLHTFKKIDPHTGKSVSRYKGKKLDANDTALIELDFVNGSVGQTQTTRWATGRLDSVFCEIHGTEGALTVDLDPGLPQINTCIGKSRHKSQWITKQLKPTPTMYQRFVRSIKTGQNDQPDLLRGAQIQAYLDACERSAKVDGKTTRIRSWI